MVNSKEDKKDPFSDKENLVVLQHCRSNPVVVEVVSIEEAISVLEVDTKEGTWTWTHNGYVASAAIGQSHSIYDDGLVGVFDRTKINHLSNMLRAYKHASNSRSNLRMYLM
jgi:hypothetical protein